MLDTAGSKNIVSARTAVAGSDGACPTLVTEGVACPAVPGSIIHVLVRGSGGAGQACVATVFGWSTGSTGVGVWYALCQLNNGAAINATTGTPVAPAGNAVFYSETFSHPGAFDRIFVMLTSVVAGSIFAVDVVFET